MKRLTGIVVLALGNACFFWGTVNATKPRELNYLAAQEVLSILPKGLRQLSVLGELAEEKMRAYNEGADQRATVDYSSEFCPIEFDPITLAMVEGLPEPSKRTIDNIQKILGAPCAEDSNKIYYRLDTNEVIYFDQSTKKGGFFSEP